MNEFEHFFNCPYCGEIISMLINLNFDNQKYIEDCEVCCHPVELNLRVNENMIDFFENYVGGQIDNNSSFNLKDRHSLFKTKSLIKASIIGSIAAACECEIDGNKPISPSKVRTKINEIERMSNYKQG